MNTDEFFQKINHFSKNFLVSENILQEPYSHLDMLKRTLLGIRIWKRFFQDTTNEISKSNSQNEKKMKLKKILKILYLKNLKLEISIIDSWIGLDSWNPRIQVYWIEKHIFLRIVNSIFQDEKRKS